MDCEKPYSSLIKGISCMVFFTGCLGILSVLECLDLSIHCYWLVMNLPIFNFLSTK